MYSISAWCLIDKITMVPVRYTNYKYEANELLNANVGPCAVEAWQSQAPLCQSRNLLLSPREVRWQPWLFPCLSIPELYSSIEQRE